MAAITEEATLFLDLTNTDDATRDDIDSILDALQAYSVIDAHNFINTPWMDTTHITMTATYTTDIEKSPIVLTHSHSVTSVDEKGPLEKLLEALRARGVIENWRYCGDPKLDLLIEYRRPLKCDQADGILAPPEGANGHDSGKAQGGC